MDRTVYNKRYPVGFPGRISRVTNLATEARIIMNDEAPDDYGLGVKLNPDGTVSGLASGDSSIYGFIVSPEVSQFTDKPQGGIMCDVMRQGYMTVKVGSGTVGAGGAVYVRNANPTDEHPLGEIMADATDGVRITEARFIGPATADNEGITIAEIAFNL